MLCVRVRAHDQGSLPFRSSSRCLGIIPSSIYAHTAVCLRASVFMYVHALTSCSRAVEQGQEEGEGEGEEETCEGREGEVRLSSQPCPVTAIHKPFPLSV